jgi:hypothetical protein
LRDSDIDVKTPDGRAKLAEMKVAVMRLRNFGAAMETIADKLQLSVRDAEAMLLMATRDIMRDDVETLVARHQTVVDDITRSQYPKLLEGDDKAAMVVLRAQEHSAKLRGLNAPTRIKVGLDPDEFGTTVAGDLAALGVRTDTDPELDDEPWADV